MNDNWREYVRCFPEQPGEDGQEMSEHTPTPWGVGPVHTKGFITANVKEVRDIEAANWVHICLDATPEDARFIVMACNSHEELLAAARGIKEWIDAIGLDRGCLDDDESNPVYDALCEAIKKAEGG